MIQLCYLVELQHVEEVEELSVLLTVLQLAVVLLQAMKCEFGLIIHEYLHGLQEVEVQSLVKP